MRNPLALLFADACHDTKPHVITGEPGVRLRLAVNSITIDLISLFIWGQGPATHPTGNTQNTYPSSGVCLVG